MICLRVLTIFGGRKMKNKIVVDSAIATILSVGLLAATQTQVVPDAPKQREKCAGIVKAGKNGCGALDGEHGCAA